MTHAYESWLGPFGWGIFFIGLVVAIILFAIRKRFYPVMYLVSTALYIFSVGFIIDAFDFERNGIFSMLAISTVVFIGVGWYVGRKFEKMKDMFSSSLSRKR